MPTMLEMLSTAQLINRAVDPDGDHQTPTSGSYDNLDKSKPLLEGRSKVASTGVIGDNQAGKEGIATMLPNDADYDDPVNENNERVVTRLRAEKERVKAALAAHPEEFASMRAGSPLNDGDISSGGMGGDLGVTAVVGRDAGVDAAQHAQAWDIAQKGEAAAAADAADTERKRGADKAKGKAGAAADSLLGDDTKPQPGATWPATK